MTARFIVGDTRAVTADIPDGSIDLIMTSPPFLALRSYLPADHPDKALEIGSEATPAAFIDVLLKLTAEWRRILAPHGSIVVELGDTYSGSGGAGGDYSEDGLREGQPKFNAPRSRAGRKNDERQWLTTDAAPVLRNGGGKGWPLAKSLVGIPERYRLSLIDGVNICNGKPSPAGRWQVRNVIRWVRPNPPVGALGKKWRPATSDLVVATPNDDARFWDGDATRVDHRPDTVAHTERYHADGKQARYRDKRLNPDSAALTSRVGKGNLNPAGAPLLDWWKIDDPQQTIAYLMGVIEELTGGDKKWAPATTEVVVATPNDDARFWDGDATRTASVNPIGVGVRPTQARVNGNDEHDNRDKLGPYTPEMQSAGAPLLDWWKIVPKGYEGSHYATFPPELCVAPIDAMCPRRVCRTCGRASERVTEHGELEATPDARITAWDRGKNHDNSGNMAANQKATGFIPNHVRPVIETSWTTCGCPGTDGLRLDGFHDGPGWRPGIVLDPFAGTGTVLAVASGMGRDSLGIDIDERNAELALERVGPLLLTVEHHDPDRPAFESSEQHNRAQQPGNTVRFRKGYLVNDGRTTPIGKDYGESA